MVNAVYQGETDITLFFSFPNNIDFNEEHTIILLL